MVLQPLEQLRKCQKLCNWWSWNILIMTNSLQFAKQLQNYYHFVPIINPRDNYCCLHFTNKDITALKDFLLLKYPWLLSDRAGYFTSRPSDSKSCDGSCKAASSRFMYTRAFKSSSERRKHSQYKILNQQLLVYHLGNAKKKYLEMFETHIWKYDSDWMKIKYMWSNRV